LEHDFYPYIGNFIIPTDFHSIIFQRGRSTTNQMLIMVQSMTDDLENCKLWPLWNQKHHPAYHLIPKVWPISLTVSEWIQVNLKIFPCFFFTTPKEIRRTVGNLEFIWIYMNLWLLRVMKHPRIVLSSNMFWGISIIQNFWKCIPDFLGNPLFWEFLKYRDDRDVSKKGNLSTQVWGHSLDPGLQKAHWGWGIGPCLVTEDHHRSCNHLHRHL
jgi:hypothetical protein